MRDEIYLGIRQICGAGLKSWWHWRVGSFSQPLIRALYPACCMVGQGKGCLSSNSCRVWQQWWEHNWSEEVCFLALRGGCLFWPYHELFGAFLHGPELEWQQRVDNLLAAGDVVDRCIYSLFRSLWSAPVGGCSLLFLFRDSLLPHSASSPAGAFTFNMEGSASHSRYCLGLQKPSVSLSHNPCCFSPHPHPFTECIGVSC